MCLFFRLSIKANIRNDLNPSGSTARAMVFFHFLICNKTECGQMISHQWFFRTLCIFTLFDKSVTDRHWSGIQEWPLAMRLQRTARTCVWFELYYHSCEVQRTLCQSTAHCRFASLCSQFFAPDLKHPLLVTPKMNAKAGLVYESKLSPV